MIASMNKVEVRRCPFWRPRRKCRWEGCAIAGKIRAAVAAGLICSITGFAHGASSLETALEYPESLKAPASARVDGLSVESAADDVDADHVTLASAFEASATGCAEPAADCCEVCDDACDDSCGCDLPTVCPPTWTAKVGAVYLTRSRPAGDATIVPLAGPGVIARGDDYGFNWAAGPDVSIQRRTAEGNAWELRYFGALDWDAADAYGAVGNVRIGSFSNFGATNLTARYRSSLDSAELNTIHPLSSRFSWLAGFRWLELSDTLTSTITFPAFSADYNWHETNHLYGAQLGGLFHFARPSDRLTFDSVFKAGVYGNDANNDFTLLPSTGGQFDGGLGGSSVAFVGEIGITGVYQLTEHIALRGGYQTLWISGVALASDNMANATALGSQANITTDGDLFYHGALMSVDFMW